jgi:hypothetical protein
VDSAKLNDWMQVIGIFALVASLLFVGLQMRQDQEIAKATLYQMRSDSARELGMVVLENPKLREVIFRSATNGTQALSPKDAMLLDFNCQTILGHFENSHHLFQLGFLSTEQWVADRSQIAQLLNSMCKLSWTGQQQSTYRPSFVEEIDAILRN